MKKLDKSNQFILKNFPFFFFPLKLCWLVSNIDKVKALQDTHIPNNFKLQRDNDTRFCLDRTKKIYYYKPDIWTLKID